MQPKKGELIINVFTVLIRSCKLVIVIISRNKWMTTRLFDSSLHSFLQFIRISAYFLCVEVVAEIIRSWKLQINSSDEWRRAISRPLAYGGMSAKRRVTLPLYSLLWIVRSWRDLWNRMLRLARERPWDAAVCFAVWPDGNTCQSRVRRGVVMSSGSSPSHTLRINDLLRVIQR